MSVLKGRGMEVDLSLMIHIAEIPGGSLERQKRLSDLDISWRLGGECHGSFMIVGFGREAILGKNTVYFAARHSQRAGGLAFGHARAIIIFPKRIAARHHESIRANPDTFLVWIMDPSSLFASFRKVALAETIEVRNA